MYCCVFDSIAFVKLPSELLTQTINNEYPTMHYFGYPRHTQSMIAFVILTENFWKFQGKIALLKCC